MIIQVISLLVFTLFVLLLFAKLKLLFHFWPSITWIFFMVLPFLLNLDYLTKIRQQATGILIFLVAFICSDYISFKKAQLAKKIICTNLNFPNWLFVVLYVVTFIVPLFHFLLVGDLPFLHVLFGDKSLSDITTDRYQFNRGAIPYWFAVISNYTLSLLGPFVLLITFIKKYFFRFVLVASWLIFYAIASGAKFPLVFLWGVFLFIVFNTIWVKHIRIINAIVLTLFLFTSMSGIALGIKALSELEKCPVPSGVVQSPANILRSCIGEEPEISINFLVDTAGYRVFLVPVEVSNHWYSNYSTEGVEKNSLSDLINRKQELKPANHIAQEYYGKFWPKKYGKYTNANGSVDAEAFAYGGIPLIVIFASILFFSRLLISIFRTNGFLGQVLEGAGIAFLLFYPNSASLPAILVPSGFLIILLFVIVSNRNILRVKRIW